MSHKNVLELSLCLACLVLACGPKPRPTPAPAGGACGPGSPCGSATPPPQEPGPTTPSASAEVSAALPPMVRDRPRAVPLDAVSARAAAQLLTPLAAHHAGPAQPVAGGALGGQFTAGQALELSLTLEPRRCYTIIAAGLPAVEEVDVELAPVTPPGVPAPILAADGGTGTTAVLGAAPSCWKHAAPVALPARIILSVPRGQGVAALQVYAR